jgi:hypothetical protein
MLIDQLRQKYPMHNVKNAPASDCPVCHGTGEFINPYKEVHLCICTCMSGDEKCRKLLTEMFQDFIQSMIHKVELKTKRSKELL